MKGLVALCVLLMSLSVPASTLAFDEVDNPGAIEPVQFEVVEEEFQDTARPRVVMRITVASGGDEEVAAAIAQAVRDGLDNNSQALVAHVFAYYIGDDTQSTYTAGIGMASRDGKGWTGDGELLGPYPQDQKDEDGKIFVVVGGALDDQNDLIELIFPIELGS